eukprot:TRINITY_DN35522_c0_g1_i1.p1 TRINITY_DN35522_c0_g1~~TRINITY_DN35522_c0_g1_i1.p1  ORF type:complete len:521 (+),score=85.60 TRINITY_DN35522_c0_g1_i1:126-1688(+)
MEHVGAHADPREELLRRKQQFFLDGLAARGAPTGAAAGPADPAPAGPPPQLQLLPLRTGAPSASGATGAPHPAALCHDVHSELTSTAGSSSHPPPDSPAPPPGDHSPAPPAAAPATAAAAAGGAAAPAPAVEPPAERARNATPVAFEEGGVPLLQLPPDRLRRRSTRRLPSSPVEAARRTPPRSPARAPPAPEAQLPPWRRPFRSFPASHAQRVEQVTSRGRLNRRVVLTLPQHVCICDEAARVTRLVPWGQVARVAYRRLPRPCELLLGTARGCGEPDIVFRLDADAGEDPAGALAAAVCDTRAAACGEPPAREELPPTAAAPSAAACLRKPPGWQPPEKRLGAAGLAHAITGLAAPGHPHAPGQPAAEQLSLPAAPAAARGPPRRRPAPGLGSAPVAPRGCQGAARGRRRGGAIKRGAARAPRAHRVAPPGRRAAVCGPPGERSDGAVRAGRRAARAAAQRAAQQQLHRGGHPAHIGVSDAAAGGPRGVGRGPRDAHQPQRWHRAGPAVLREPRLSRD